MQAADDGCGLRKLPRLRDELLHREVRVVFVQDGPDDAVSVGFGNQRKKFASEKRFFAAHADVDEMFENRAVAESSGAGIEEHEKNVASGGSAAKRVEMIALHFERRNFLRFEFGFHRGRIELAERDADNVVSAAAADVGPGNFFNLRIRVHAGGT